MGRCFGSTWLWRGLSGPELSAAAEFLMGLSDNNTDQAQSRMRVIGKTATLETVRALVKLELIIVDSTAPQLSRQGREFLEGIHCRQSP
jgi:hypothetical protein